MVERWASHEEERNRAPEERSEELRVEELEEGAGEIEEDLTNYLLCDLNVQCPSRM